MEIKTENLLAGYNAADENTKQVLRAMFPDMEWNATQKDNRPVTERIKTFADACEALGIEAETEEERLQNLMPDEVAYAKLRIITAALNEGWEPQFTQDEWRWYPWFTLWTEDELAFKSEEWKQERCLRPTSAYKGEWAGLAFADSNAAPSNTTAYFGSRLCFRTDTLAEYAGKQFIDLWMDFYLIRK